MSNRNDDPDYLEDPESVSPHTASGIDGWLRISRAWPVVVSLAAAAVLWVAEAGLHAWLDGGDFLRRIVDPGPVETRILAAAAAFFVGAGVTVQMMQARCHDRMDALETELESTRRKMTKLASGKTRSQWRAAYVLHEVVSQDLSIVVSILRSVRGEERQDEVGRKVERAAAIVNASLNDLERTALSLSPGLANELELEPAFELLAERLKREQGIDARFELDPAWRLLIGPRQDALRELLGSIVSKAANLETVTFIHLRLDRKGNQLNITAAYDGADAHEKPYLDDVCASLGGVCAAEAVPERGTSLKVSIPIEAVSVPAGSKSAAKKGV